MKKMKVAVTGAFGYSGSIIAQKLLKEGCSVYALTNNKGNADSGSFSGTGPLCFGKPEQLTRFLTGLDALVVNYWVRFNYKTFNHEEAVHNLKTIITCAARAGVKRIVYVSITNPSEKSDLSYFNGKARVEKHLKECGVPYAIVRPAVLFGGKDILINNIAWMIRKFPVFGVFGDGTYRLQPVHVDDLADIVIEALNTDRSYTIDAIGPETFTYIELANTIMKGIGKKRRILKLSPGFGMIASKILQLFVHDVVITRDEIKGLMQNYLYVESEPTGKIHFTEWLSENSDTLGLSYASELQRRKR